MTESSGTKTANLSGVQDPSEHARLKVLASRITLENNWPYLASIAFALRLVETSSEDLPTMAVDNGLRLYYNVDFVESLEPEELATVLLHECMHVILRHGDRYAELQNAGYYEQFSSAPAYHRLIWNYAGDCSINETLDEMDVIWPKSSPPLRYSLFRKAGLTAKDITETSFFKILEWDKEYLATGNPQDSKLNLPCDCGSISDGENRGFEIPVDDEDAPGADNLERDRLRDKVASDITQHASTGSIPKGLERWAQAHLDPKIDWRRQLAVRIRQAVANVTGRRDYSYMRPSRRQDAIRATGSSVILPAMRQPAPPRIAIVADTSGSISNNDLNQFLAEIKGMLNAVGIGQGMSIIPCDAKAYPAIKIRSRSSIIEINFQGGGGTNMISGIDAAMSMRPLPQIVIILTDGYTPWPEAKPKGCDHFIAALTDEKTKQSLPHWITAVSLAD